MFTKEHYVEIAKVLRASIDGLQSRNTSVICDFVSLFKKDNPKFDEDKFDGMVYGREVSENKGDREEKFVKALEWLENASYNCSNIEIVGVALVPTVKSQIDNAIKYLRDEEITNEIW